MLVPVCLSVCVCVCVPVITISRNNNNRKMFKFCVFYISITNILPEMFYENSVNSFYTKAHKTFHNMKVDGESFMVMYVKVYELK